MKKVYEKLESTIKYLRDEHPTLPNHVFESLSEVRSEMLQIINKQRCDECDRYEHYDEVLGIWKCEQCDKNPKKV